MNPEYEGGKTWLNLERPLDSELDGNGEKIKEWLIHSAVELMRIR